MKIKIFYTFLVLTVFAFAGDKTETYNFKGFTNVSVGNGMRVDIKQGNDYKVEASGDETAMHGLIVKKKGSKLSFYFEKKDIAVKNKIQISITMPKLTAIGLHDGAEGTIDMDVRQEEFAAALSGGSQLNGTLKCGDINFALSGGSKLKLAGSGGNASIAASGSSSYNLKNFDVKDVSAGLSGGSEVTVTMDGKLQCGMSGGSTVTYYGNAEIESNGSSGGSRIIKGE